MSTAARAPRIFALLLFCFAAASAAADDWPQFGGPNRDGAVGQAGIPAPPLRLETLWKKPLGSGYSGVSVAAGIVVTLYSAAGSDYLAAFDAATGDVRWSLALGAVYEGHDGSDDGPLSTPLIQGGRVFAVTPRGALLAVSLDKGKALWQVSLTEAYRAVAPEYGFTTSPIVAGDLIAVQVGGPDGHGLCAFDPATGEIRWKLGDEPAEYRSPIPVSVRGRTQLVVLANRTIRGVDPATGRLLWQHSVEDDRYEGNASLVPIGRGRFLITGWEQSRLFEVVPTDESFVLEERWQTAEIKQAYGAPVHHDGVLYGYNGSYLTAVDAATGERVWKSREPGRGVPIRVDDQLVIWAQGGKLYVAPTGKDGFAPVAQVDVLQSASLTAPAFADGVVYVRNLEQIAAVAVRQAPAASGAAEPASAARPATSGAIGRFLAKFDRAGADTAELDDYLDAQTSFPLVEPGEIVHFVYRGPAKDVGISGSMIPRGSQSLQPISGTDVFFRTYRLQPGARVEYSLIVDFGDPQADPRNPAVAAGSDGKRSELRLPGWQVPDYAALPFAEPAGKFETFEIESKALGDTRKVGVYLPPGYAASEQRYPLLVVPDIDGTRTHGRLPEIVDRLAAAGRPSVILAFVPFGAGFDFFPEGYAGRRDDMVRFVADEMLPEIAKRFRVRDGRENRAALGFGWGAFPALYAAVTRSDVFGRVATVSLLTYGPLNDELAATLAAKPGVPLLDVYVGWGLYDSSEEFAEHISLRVTNRAVAEILGAHGHRVETREIPAGIGWGSFWADVGPALEPWFGAHDDPR